MEDGDDEAEEETVGDKIAKYRKAQNRACDSSSSSESERQPPTGRTTRPTSADLAALMDDGFSQDLSQPSTGVAVGHAVPFAALPRRSPTTEGTALPPLYPNAPPLDYRDDPFSPFAPGGMMYKGPSAIPTPRSRVPSPATTARSASPALSASGTAPKKKKAAKKTPEDVAKEEELQKDIEKVIDSFKEEYRPYILCEEEQDLKNPLDKEFHCVAKWLPVNKPTKRKLDIAMFNSKQMRKFAQNAGIKGGGNMTLFQARKKIATAMNMGTVYNDNPKGRLIP
jgi:hypothetical protein